jgi:hypothetical protein
MGKRELVLILGFVVAGIIVFQLTAPAGDGEGFSFSRLWNRARAEISSNSASATVARRDAIPVPAEVEELQLTDLPSGLQVSGEERADIQYELEVNSTGPDQQTAAESAKKVTVRSDRVGSLLTLSMFYPPEARQTAKATLRVPKRLSLRLQNGRRVTVTGVASVRLDPALGDTRLEGVAGAVTGTHRGGAIAITRAASVNLSVVNSSVTISEVARGIALDVRSGGNTTIEGTAGALEIEAVNATISVARHAGSIRMTGSGGRVSVDGPAADTRLEMRGTEIELMIRDAVPVTAQTSEDTLRVIVIGSPAVRIDALADGGTIQAPEFGLQPEEIEGRQRLQASVGDRATATIALRNRRSDIVIRKGK